VSIETINLIVESDLASRRHGDWQILQPSYASYRETKNAATVEE
jgi:hypothetical protein